ncbi:protofilament ribbon protein [Thecamonas trahens ATCC 50062]|uniref:Protofilament ribbon protein n=1 Tax=Thecamonas trahens ATCC 50062 TaxID=461836 RepID=A0A0L0D2D9_THETB|nr:protofilament ribbon protein [Thecamonas trahens ATCC 50062]KNC46361.1 protofilament ribbon protein [Thecamonas trahens ATCC 50062]|eukprot:XP_013760654.1 protofilament ribbon protein [Thecamonas trahens ATCC 50062]
MFALERDEREARAIERRRMLEEERRQRIFNPKARTIGVDVAALDEQVRIKEEAERAAAEREAAYAAEQERVRRQLLQLEAQAAEQRRDVLREQEAYRQRYQTYDSRKEFDLNDPDYLRKDLPARVADDDERLGPASLQKFEGEDLTGEERRKAQQEQMRRWVALQLAQKKQKQREEEEAQRLYELRQQEMTLRGLEMEEAQNRTRRAVQTAVKDYNAALAAEWAERERARKLAETREGLEEIHNNLNSDLLCENPYKAAAASQLPGRVVVTEFKGLLPEERERIRAIQAEQAEERARIEAARAEEERRWELQAEANRRAALRLEAQNQRERRAVNERVSGENAQLAAEARQRQEFINNKLYTNQPTQAYWDQWNTSTR